MPSVVGWPSRFPLDAALERKRDILKSAAAGKWFILQLLAGVVLLQDAQWGSGAAAAAGNAYIAMFEQMLALLCLTSGAWNAWRRFFPVAAGKSIAVTARQMQLMGISKSDPGFVEAVDAARASGAQGKKGPYPSPFSPPREGSFIASSPSTSTPLLAASSAAAARSPGPSPNSSWRSGSAMTPPSAATSLSSSWVYHGREASAADAGSPAAAAQQQQVANHRRSHFNMSGNSSLTDENQLDEYLREFETWEKNNSGVTAAAAAMEQNSVSASASFWKSGSAAGVTTAGHGTNVQDYSPVLKKFSYQLSTVMPGATLTGKDGDKKALSPSAAGGKEESSLCRAVDREPMDIVDWHQNLRLWISQTVLSRLVCEIDATNKDLCKHGMSDCQIGVGAAGLERLRKISQLPTIATQHVPSLPALLPFLEVTLHQAYLVGRIRQLGAGGAMSEFRWNGGGRVANVDWSDKLPTDAELVMHFIATYLDTQLPPNHVSTAMSGGPIAAGTFSTCHYFKAPEKSEAVKYKVHQCAIIQTSLKPPNFVLQIGDGVTANKLEVSPGRNNLFHTLLLFLHHIKTKENGMLGRINFGKSGVNVLWVID